jgi:hypothetical protein
MSGTDPDSCWTFLKTYSLGGAATALPQSIITSTGFDAATDLVNGRFRGIVFAVISEGPSLRRCCREALDVLAFLICSISGASIVSSIPFRTNALNLSLPKRRIAKVDQIRAGDWCTASVVVGLRAAAACWIKGLFAPLRSR